MTAWTSTAITKRSVRTSRVRLTRLPGSCIGSLIEKVYGDELGDVGGNHVRPDGFHLGAVGERLAHFDGGIGRGVAIFRDQRAMLDAVNHLPFQNATFV